MKKSHLLAGLASLASLAASVAAVAQPALTIYNKDFAVVRERLPLTLVAGTTQASFAGVTSQVEADSVVLRDPSGKVAFRVLEQSYRADTVSAGLLLALNEGNTLDFLVRGENAKEYTVRGKVIRSGYLPGGGAEAPIVEVDGALRFSLPGEPLFPSLADAGVLKPTLTWTLGAEQAATLTAELGYLTGGMSWQAAYNFVAPETGDEIDLVGWVTVTNNTGKTFENAAIKLMAGDVNKVEPQYKQRREVMYAAMATGRAKSDEVTEKAFDEFHLYTLPRATTLRDRETKQVEFMRGTGVKAPVVYVFDGAHTNRGDGKGKVAVMREFANTEKNGLGLPLPAGRTRFYRRDSADGRLEFVGENTIEHTAKNETVRIRTGDAFDIVGERQISDASASSRKSNFEQAVTVTLRNRKTTPVEVRVVEHTLAQANWEITEKSDTFTKTNATEFEFRVTLKPDEERKVTYRIRYQDQ